MNGMWRARVGLRTNKTTKQEEEYDGIYKRNVGKAKSRIESTRNDCLKMAYSDEMIGIAVELAATISELNVVANKMQITLDESITSAFTALKSQLQTDGITDYLLAFQRPAKGADANNFRLRNFMARLTQLFGLQVAMIERFIARVGTRAHVNSYSTYVEGIKSLLSTLKGKYDKETFTVALPDVIEMDGLTKYIGALTDRMIKLPVDPTYGVSEIGSTMRLISKAMTPLYSSFYFKRGETDSIAVGVAKAEKK